jgi:hypothetical protein
LSETGWPSSGDQVRVLKFEQEKRDGGRCTALYRLCSYSKCCSGKVRYLGVSNYAAAQLELLQNNVDQALIANHDYIGADGAALHGFHLSTDWIPE